MKPPKTIIPKKELAGRWGVSISHIETLEAQGVLKRTKIGRCTYPMEQVLQLEGTGQTTQTFQKMRKLQDDLKALKNENIQLRKIIKSLTENII